MPPKNKKKPASAPKETGSEAVVEIHQPSEREVQLKAQLDGVTSELTSLKRQVDELKIENDFLHQEAQHVRVETQEYLSYVSKKTKKRQDAVISLSDRNTEKIEEIRLKKEQVIDNYNKERERYNEIILNKEAELTNIQNELSELNEYRVLQREQEAEISALEKRMSDMRVKHNEAVQKLKARFLAEKNAFQKESENELSEMCREAKKDAHACLAQHTVKIKFENRALRRELLEFIEKTRALHTHKLELEEQKKILLREKDYAGVLQGLRSKRMENMLKSHGVNTT